MSLAPADLIRVLTIAAEFQEHDACQTDPRFRRHGRLDVSVALIVAVELDAGLDLFPVDGGPEPAQIFEEKLSGFRIAPQPEMLAGNVGQGVEFQVGPVVPAAAPDHDLVPGHAERLP